MFQGLSGAVPLPILVSGTENVRISVLESKAMSGS